jgi:hypothetical protein
MTLNKVDPNPINDDETSTIHGGAATPPSTIPDFLESLDPLGTPTMSTVVPWPGSTYLLRDSVTGCVLTLSHGQVSLQPQNLGGSKEWQCVETKGWLGFRNPVSGKFLGHDARGKLHCGADRHLPWENFCARVRPQGGVVLLMMHYERLWCVGEKQTNNQRVLMKLSDGADKEEAIVWEFVKVG